MIKEIPNLKEYFIDDKGNVYSNKSGTLKQLKPFLDSKKRYLMFTACISGERRKILVHRAVALTFLPQIDGKNVVNHKNSITTDNCVDNLEWCTTQENVHHSYQTQNQIRNHCFCKLYIKNTCIGIFPSINEACLFAKNKGYSYTTLNKYKKTKDCFIEKV